MSSYFSLSTAREGFGRMFQIIHHDSPYEEFSYSDALVLSFLWAPFERASARCFKWSIMSRPMNSSTIPMHCFFTNMSIVATMLVINAAKLLQDTAGLLEVCFWFGFVALSSFNNHLNTECQPEWNRILASSKQRISYHFCAQWEKEKHKASARSGRTYVSLSDMLQAHTRGTRRDRSGT